MSEPHRPPSNRRASTRQPGKGTTKVTCRKGSLDLGLNLALKLLDVSESGIRLIIQAALEVGQEVTIGLEGPTQGRPVSRIGKVAWVVPSEAGCCIGVRFEKYLEYKDLQMIANRQ